MQAPPHAGLFVGARGTPGSWPDSCAYPRITSSERDVLAVALNIQETFGSMANFVAIVDPDDGRRLRFQHAVQPLLAVLDGLAPGKCAAGNFLALWAAAKDAPLSLMSDSQSATLLWGDAMDDRTGRRIDAQQLNDRWRDLESPVPPLDGYHAALTYDARRNSVTAGVDLLGLFPLYYADLGDVLLIGSSPELFRRHPRFDCQIDPLALVGIMLTMHLLQGRTLCRGSRRLPAGHLLRWQADGQPLEVEQYRVRPSRRFFALPFSSHTAILGEAIEESVRRHAPAGPRYGLLLSGGRDSRLLAGYMRKHALQVSALSLGTDEDLEIECAQAVSRTLRFDHRVREIDEGAYVDYAWRQVTWEHGAQGFNTIMGWGLPRLAQEMPAYMVNGYVGDAIVGGSHIDWACAGASHEASFDAFFARVNAYGIHAGTLRKLLRKDVFDDSVDDVLDGARDLYCSYSDLESERAWCFDLYHRQRFHIGGEIWKLSWGAWPICPFVDRHLLEVCGAMPASTLAERRVEDAVLCKYFPHLAELPVDRNSFDATPLRPRIRHLAGAALRKRLGRGSPKGERRRYYRLWNINGAAWIAVRREAEKSRHLAYEFFDKGVLDSILPPPDAPIGYKDGIMDTSGLKSLIGFMLWLGRMHARL
jgi:asparagine synthase (glutamine-hydrolysing)